MPKTKNLSTKFNKLHIERTEEWIKANTVVNKRCEHSWLPYQYQKANEGSVYTGYKGVDRLRAVYCHTCKEIEFIPPHDKLQEKLYTRLDEFDD
jgi:hypothetical protein